MTAITGAQLRAVMGTSAPRCDEIAAAFNAGASKVELDAPLRTAHFFAQIGHESGRFRYVREIWGPTAVQTRYEGRRDLGNTQSGDGKRFMGRSLIQITGRANARAFSAWARPYYPDAPDFEAHPEAMEQMPWALVGAFWFWSTRGLNALADRDDLIGITKRVNGGLNGLDDRKTLLVRAKAAFVTRMPAPTPPVTVEPLPAPVAAESRVAEPAPAPVPSRNLLQRMADRLRAAYPRKV